MFNLTQDELRLLKENGFCVAMRNKNDFLVEQIEPGKRKITKILNGNLEF